MTFEVQQEALWRWAAERVPPWGKVQKDDCDFRWINGAPKQLLKAGCIYEYARESRKLRGLLVLLNPERKREPFETKSHSAVWTGSEMIVWGGLDFDNDKLLNTGGKYNPNTDSWTATSTTNTPSIRADHTAVWIGSEMTVWGGQTQNAVPVNTGARYNPITNSWTATSTTNAPTARYLDIAVWTGSEMIIWGGWNGSHVENTGGRYDAAGFSWMATATPNAPVARANHTGVWTGGVMIVWGGGNKTGLALNTGGSYCTQSGPTPTPTPCPGRCSPTPRPRPTPAPRPTP